MLKDIKFYLKKNYPLLVSKYKILKSKNIPNDYIQDIVNLSNNPNFNLSFQKKPLIFDVGSNIGASVLNLLRIKNSTIHCFEPVKSTFDILKSNLSSFKNLKLNNCALDYLGLDQSNYQLRKNMYVYKHSNLISNFFEETQLTKKTENIHKELVDTTSIDNYCIANSIDFIDILRLDVNGYELNTLKGAEKILNKRGINFIHFSFYNIKTEDNIGSLHELHKYLDKYNYRLGYFYNDFIHAERKGGYYFATYIKNNLSPINIIN